MKELQELIAFLKAKKLEHHKIDIDILVGIIEFFNSKQESKKIIEDKQKLQIEYAVLSRTTELYPKNSHHYAYLEINKRMDEILEILKY